MRDILYRQMAIDFCCSFEDVSDAGNHFTEFQYPEGRRRFREEPECFLKLAVINNKLLFTGKKDIVEWCRHEYSGTGSAWFLEAKNLRRLNDRLHEDGYQIELLHPFYIPGKHVEADPGRYEIRWFDNKEIEQFRGDSRFTEAYSFCGSAPDVIGVAAVQNDRILGMAGASADSPLMWQIGINVEEDARGAGIGKLLVVLLKNRIQEQGILPYYGTAFSHIASQKVALGSGFIPAWVELTTSKQAPERN